MNNVKPVTYLCIIIIISFLTMVLIILFVYPLSLPPILIGACMSIVIAVSAWITHNKIILKIT